MTAETTRQVYLLIEGQITRIQQTKTEAQLTLNAATERLDHLKALKKQVEEVICLGCEGHGKIRVWEAQDESRIETCTSCNGSGLRKGAV